MSILGCGYFARSQYRISQWNYYDIDGPRTNNHVEGWHSQLKKIVGKSHFNLFEIMDVMPKEQATIDMKLNQFEDSAMLPPRKRRYVQRDENISTLSERFQNGRCNLYVADYLDKLSSSMYSTEL